MNKIKRVGASTKNFVYKHRVAVAVTLTAVTCLKLNRVRLDAHDEFLRQHNLLDEFYIAA